MQGNLILNADPTANLGAATKQYVDKSFNSLRKRRRLFTQTKTYNNFTSGSPATDLLFTLPQMSYEEIDFYPTKMFVELSAQNYSASNGLSSNSLYEYNYGDSTVKSSKDTLNNGYFTGELKFSKLNRSYYLFMIKLK